MHRILSSLVCVAFCFGFAVRPAFAGEGDWYVLGDVGQLSSNNDQSTLDSALASSGGSGFTSSLSNPTVYNLDLGYKFSEAFAIEGGYFGSTNENYSASGGNLAGTFTASAKVTGWDIKAVGFLPVAQQFSILGKLGIADLKDSATFSDTAATNDISGTKTALTYGVGVQYDFMGPAMVRLSWDSYDIGSSSSASRSNVISIGLGWKL